MIELRGLTKVYGPTKAVDDLSFTVKPGIVTGFLGPNGAGKSTTMRMILGLDQPTSGAALIEGKPYRELKTPLRTVGALLDAKWVHPNRSARAHLQWMAASNGIPKSRVDEVLGLVGLSEVAGKKAGGFSLGMSQRLGLAGALLGDPKVLLFDEPVNGLDPEGIVWIRKFMQRLAAEGRTVLVSSHLLSEMALTAEQLVVIGRGRLISDSTVAEFVDRSSESTVRVRSPQLDALRSVLLSQGLTVREDGSGVAPALVVVDSTTDVIGGLAGSQGIVFVRVGFSAGVARGCVHEVDRGRCPVPRIRYRSGCRCTPRKYTAGKHAAGKHAAGKHAAGYGRCTVMAVLSAERIKITTTKSPLWCTIIIIVLGLGLATVFGLSAKSSLSNPNGAMMPTVSGALSGVTGFGVLVLMIMAALAITSEYRFGTIRTTFQAVPEPRLGAHRQSGPHRWVRSGADSRVVVRRLRPHEGHIR